MTSSTIQLKTPIALVLVLAGMSLQATASTSLNTDLTQPNGSSSASE